MAITVAQEGDRLSFGNKSGILLKVTGDASECTVATGLTHVDAAWWVGSTADQPGVVLNSNDGTEDTSDGDCECTTAVGSAVVAYLMVLGF